MSLTAFLDGQRDWWVEVGDSMTDLYRIPDNAIDCCVTSPPYLRQRLYGQDAREIGREVSLAGWCTTLVTVFASVHRAMAPHGTLWLNLGEKWSQSGFGHGRLASKHKAWAGTVGVAGPTRIEGFAPKNLTLAPFELARRLQDWGWYLRQTIIWEKPSAVEPARLDRPSMSHEYVFLLSKSEQCAARDPGEPWWKSSVWRISQGKGRSATSGHTAGMPPELARRCIVAGTRPGQCIFDPFGGRGTTVMAALREGRRALAWELLETEAEAARQRITSDAPLFNSARVRMIDVPKTTAVQIELEF